MDAKTPKHRQISVFLRAQIAAGKYAKGRRLPSEAELARRFHVSRPTAGRALLELLQANLIERRVGSGTYLKQTASKERDRHTVGLLVPGLGNTEILDPICTELTRFGQNNGFEVLWGDASNPVATAEEAEQLCQQYIDRSVAGVFFAPLESVPQREEVNLSITSALRNAGIAVVLLDRDICEFPRRSDFDLVGIDNFQAGMILAQHLLDFGHRKFLFLARPSFPSTTDLRFAGCREAIARGGAIESQMQVGEPSEIDFVRTLIEPKHPDVIVCSNDRTAALLIQTLNNLGTRVPENVRVVGFDDVKYATLLSVPLTTIRQPCREIGQTAVRTMQERIEDPNLSARQILLPVELIVRQSCARAKEN